MRLIEDLRWTKHLVVLCLIMSAAGLLSGCMPKELPTVWENGDEIVVAKFSHQTTRAEVEDVAAALRDDYGIFFSTDGSTYFEDDKLRDLVLVITLPNGTVARTNAPLSKLQYAYYGFLIRKVDGEWSQLKVGNIF